MFDTQIQNFQRDDGQGPRLRTVAQMLEMPKYAWATNSFLRHAIFKADGGFGSGGATTPGNGLAPAIVRIGRKVLIDIDEFDLWVERHRMQSRSSGKVVRCNTRAVQSDNGVGG